jgi:hypothetical protein
MVRFRWSEWRVKRVPLRLCRVVKFAPQPTIVHRKRPSRCLRASAASRTAGVATARICSPNESYDATEVTLDPEVTEPEGTLENVDTLSLVGSCLLINSGDGARELLSESRLPKGSGDGVE